MATDLYGYTSQEVLNKVLNESSSSFKVDIVSGAEYAEDSAHTSSDTGQFVLGVRNDTLAALGGSDGDYVPFQMNSSGAVYVDIADGGQFDTLLDTLETTLTSIETDAAAIETLITSTNTKLDTLETTANAQETLLTGIDADTNAIKTAIQLLDNAVDGNYLNVNMNLAGSDAQAGEGTISATTQRVTIATDDDGVAHLATIAGAVSTEMQVDVVGSLPAGDNNIGNVDIASSLPAGDNNKGNVDIASSLPAGSNAIGKLAANSGVDIGDVDVTSLPASTNTIEVVGDAAEDAAVAGNPLLSGGRYDSSERTLDNGDVGALALDPTGAVYVREYLGQSGSILVTGTTAVTTSISGTKFVAIQFIEDTVFASSGGLVATTEQLWPDDTGASTNIDNDGGSPIDSVTFPQGMTIFGRWDGFTLASGKCIGYLGKV